MLRMVVPTLDAATYRCTNHDFGLKVVARAIPELRQLVHDLVVRWPNEVRQLDLGHRHQAVHGHADGTADDAQFAERRVDHAVITELVV